MTKRILPIVALLSLPVFAQAQEPAADNGFYVHANVAQTSYDDGLIDDEDISRSLNAGYRFLGGRVAVEVGRAEADFASGGIGFSTDINSVRAMWRALRRDSVSFIVGAGYHDIDYDLTLAGDTFSDSESASSAFVGMEVDTNTVFARFALEKLYGLPDDASARQLSLGVGYRF